MRHSVEEIVLVFVSSDSRVRMGTWKLVGDIWEKLSNNEGCALMIWVPYITRSVPISTSVQEGAGGVCPLGNAVREHSKVLSETVALSNFDFFPNYSSS